MLFPLFDSMFLVFFIRDIKTITTISIGWIYILTHTLSFSTTKMFLIWRCNAFFSDFGGRTLRGFFNRLRMQGVQINSDNNSKFIIANEFCKKFTLRRNNVFTIHLHQCCYQLYPLFSLGVVWNLCFWKMLAICNETHVHYFFVQHSQFGFLKYVLVSFSAAKFCCRYVEIEKVVAACHRHRMYGKCFCFN